MKKHTISPYIYPGLNFTNISLLLELKDIKLGIMSKEMVMRIISEECNVTEEDILSRCRNKEVVFARHLYCSILKRFFGYTLKKIGGILKRDHTTVISSIGAFRKRYIKDLGYREVVHTIYNRVGIKTF